MYSPIPCGDEFDGISVKFAITGNPNIIPNIIAIIIHLINPINTISFTYIKRSELSCKELKAKCYLFFLQSFSNTTKINIMKVSSK